MHAIAPFRGGLRRHLILLVLVALVPMLLCAGGLAWWNSVKERRAIELGLTETVRALTIATDQKMALTMEALASAALSRPMIEADYPRFANVLRDLVARHPGWAYASLVDEAGRQVFTTQPSAGDRPTAEEGEPAAIFRQVTESRRPAVSNLFIDRVSHRPLVAVAVPVFNTNNRVLVLIAALLPEQIAAVLRQQQGLEGWLASVVDGNGTLIARTIRHNEFVGLPALAWWREATASHDHGILSGPSLHGQIYTYAFQRSHLTGWIIGFGVPREVFTATFNQSLAVTAIVGGLVIIGSILLALAVARRILAPVQALTAAARPFIHDTHGRRRQYDIAELDELHRALDGLAEDLARSRQRFQKVFSVAPVMLFVCDDAYRLTEVNDIWLKTLGYERDEVLGKTPFDFHTPDSCNYCREVVVPHFLGTGMVDDMPAQYVTKAGDIRDVLVSLRGEYDDDGTIIRTIGALRDVTEPRRVEAALHRAIDDAAKANEAKTRFLAAASHDLRQPLQALSLYLGVLRHRLGAGEAPIMTAIGQCVDSLTGLLDDMLDVARLDAGAITPRMSEVPVARLTRRVAAAWSIQAEVKGLQLRIADCGAVVRTDPTLMDRVLSNLVGNAVRYTERGRILVGCRRAGPDQLRLEVWDSGIGIPTDKLGDIFEEFRQLDNAERRRDRGTGLGLAIVQRISRLLGHRLQVRSWPGQGSVFSVTLNAAAARSAPEAAAVEQAPPPRRRILVVDDEAHVRTALAMVLRELGHDVDTAETIDEALDLVGQDKPQLVIADFRLGGGHTGIELVNAVRSRMDRDVPAVVLTGDTDPATIHRIAGAGLHLLHKPLQVEALKTFLGQVA